MDGTPISPSQSFALTEAELKALTRRAHSGDADAAYRVYQYHSVFKSDPYVALPLLEQAAAEGHPDAKRSLEMLRKAPRQP